MIIRPGLRSTWQATQSDRLLQLIYAPFLFLFEFLSVDILIFCLSKLYPLVIHLYYFTFFFVLFVSIYIGWSSLPFNILDKNQNLMKVWVKVQRVSED